MEIEFAGQNESSYEVSVIHNTEGEAYVDVEQPFEDGEYCKLINFINESPPKFLQDIFTNPLVEFKQSNLINPASVAGAFTDPEGEYDLVVNLAAETKYGQSDAVYQEGTVNLSMNCAREAAKHNVRMFVELSTGQVYAADKKFVFIRSFQNNLLTYRMLTKLRPPKDKCDPSGTSCSTGIKLGVMSIGAPACGSNAAVRSFVRVALTKGYEVLGLHDSFDGLIFGNTTGLIDPVKPMSWTDVQGWSGHGGSLLGTKKCVGSRYGMQKIAEKLKENNISGLLIIGGFEAYHSALEMAEARKEFDAFCIPMVVIPCTISNNVPGTDFSLGADTALNEITDICDRIKQSATGTKRRVFVVETMGGYCGYLATMSGLAGGADAAYIFEEDVNITMLRDDVFHLKDKIVNMGVQRGLILRNENANSNYTTDFIEHLFSEEGKGVFTCRKNVLGHMQQGGMPSPFDRNFGTKMAAKALHYMSDQIQQSVESLLSSNSATEDQRKNEFPCSIFRHRIPKDQWWLKLRPLLRILTKHKEKAYTPEGIFAGVDDFEDEDNI
uniref:6-phosphofructokinase n=1 Tax=Magallana gigas TaxID=29159 RepID=K1Q6M6_MAGGI